jgi:hypothetical protein
MARPQGIENVIEIKYDSKASEYTVISASREKLSRKKKGAWMISSVVVIDAIQNVEKVAAPAPSKAFGFIRSRSRADDRRLSPAKSRGRYSALDRHRSFSKQPDSSCIPPVREASVSVRRRNLDIAMEPPKLEPRRARSFSLRPTSKESSSRPIVRESSIRRRKNGNSGTDGSVCDDITLLPTQLVPRRARSFSIRALSKQALTTLPPVRESSAHRRTNIDDGKKGSRRPPLPISGTRRSTRSFRILPIAPKLR